jgi:RNA polymerase sigma-70 factor, ECF subfamily
MTKWSFLPMACRLRRRDPVGMIATSDRPALVPSQPALDPESRRWIKRLAPGSPEFEAGIEELHALLLKGARFEIQRRRARLPSLRGDDYEDLAQQSADDALLAVLHKLGDFRGESRFTTWAYKFALLDAGARIRSRAWQGRDVPTESDRLAQLASCASTAQQDVEMKELFAVLKHSIATDLSSHQRKVLVAVVLNDVPIDVLAARRGTTRGAIYKTMHDARLKLRRALEIRQLA